MIQWTIMCSVCFFDHFNDCFPLFVLLYKNLVMQDTILIKILMLVIYRFCLFFQYKKIVLQTPNSRAILIVTMSVP